jgi:hypothetical protein
VAHLFDPVAGGWRVVDEDVVEVGSEEAPVLDEGVLAVAAVDQLGLVDARPGLVAGVEVVLVEPAVELVLAVAPLQAVVAEPALHVVVAPLATEGIVAGAGLHRVVPLAPEEDIVPAVAEQGVVAVPAVQGVVGGQLGRVVPIAD